VHEDGRQNAEEEARAVDFNDGFRHPLLTFDRSSKQAEGYCRKFFSAKD
jgi:hypothetical protein